MEKRKEGKLQGIQNDLKIKKANENKNKECRLEN